MNHAQRKYLIDKIKKGVDINIEALRASMPEMPDAGNYLFHAAMSGKLKVRPTHELEELFRQRALKSKAGKSWLTTKNAWGNDEKIVNLEFDEIFIIPEELNKLREECKQKRAEIQTKISDIHIKSESLITRITLASDKTLQTMINEVDDMGDISLMDTKLKLLTQ